MYVSPTGVNLLEKKRNFDIELTLSSLASLTYVDFRTLAAQDHPLVGRFVFDLGTPTLDPAG